MSYSLPYLIFILFILAISILQIAMPLDTKSRKHLNLLIIFVYVIFFGFRGLVGWDWYNYYPYFKKLNSFIYNGYEPGFVAYTYFIKLLFHSYQSFVLISTIIDIVLLDIFLRRYVEAKYYAFALALFIGFAGIVLQTDLMRNIKSILIFMISIKYIENRKFSKYLILNLIGLLFHWTSIFLIPLYFLYKKPFSLKFILTIFIVGNIIILFNIHYIKPLLLYLANFIGGTTKIKIFYYLSDKLYSKPYDISYGYFIRQITTLLVMFYYTKILNKSKSNIVFLNSFIILMSVYLFFSEASIAIARLNIIFNFSMAIMIIILFNVIVPISTRLFLFLIYSLLILAKTHSTTNNILYKYDNALIENIQSYKERVNIYNLNHIKLLKGKNQ